MPTRFPTVAAAITSIGTVDPNWVAKGARQVAAKYGSLIERYRGDVPASLIEARVWSESRGDPTTAPSSTSEVGLLQVWDSQAQTYGISNKKDPAQNLFAGLAWWNAVGKRLKELHGFMAPDADFWLVTYVALNIGRPAVSLILNHMKTRGYAPSARALEAFVHLYKEDLSQFKDRNWFGTQTIDSVAWRIVSARQWLLGAQQLGPVNSSGFGQAYGKWGAFTPTAAAATADRIGNLLALGLGGYALYKWWQGR